MKFTTVCTPSKNDIEQRSILFILNYRNQSLLSVHLHCSSRENNTTSEYNTLVTIAGYNSDNNSDKMG